jgi:hypothetical protein
MSDFLHFSVTLKDLSLSLSLSLSQVKIEKLVTAMGGMLLPKASLDVSFVIVKNVLAAKYKVWHMKMCSIHLGTLQESKTDWSSQIIKCLKF